jgi:hypothetical protein
MNRTHVSRRSLLEWAVPVAVLAAIWLTSVVASSIEPFNRMSARTTRLPIDSLPRKPVLQLEFARGSADVETILEVGRDTQARNVSDVRKGNELDSWRLIPSYTLLFILLTLLVAQGTKRIGLRMFLVGVAVAVIIAGFDWRENSGITQLLNSPANASITSEAAARVAQSAFIKWVLIGTFFLALGVAAYLQQTWRRFLGSVLFLAGIWVLAPIWRHAVDRWFG